MRLAYVVSEHSEGLRPEVLADVDSAVARLAALADAEVVTAHYTELASVTADALVLSGSIDPWSAHDPRDLEDLDDAVRAYPGPVLGICAGMQTLVRAGGGSIGHAPASVEAGFAAVEIEDDSDLFAGLGGIVVVFEHHDDEVASLPPGCRILARSPGCAVEAFALRGRPWWGTQFHPEKWSDAHPAGRVVLENFLGLAGIPPR